MEGKMTPGRFVYDFSRRRKEYEAEHGHKPERVEISGALAAVLGGYDGTLTVMAGPEYKVLGTPAAIVDDTAIWYRII